MEPVSILSIAAATSTIIVRVGTLVHSLTSLASKFRHAQRSATQLATRLQLFSETLRELETYIRRATQLLRRAKSMLRLSLIACEDVLAEIEGYVANANRQTSRLSIFGRAKHLWNEESVTECERKLSISLQVLSSYIQLLNLLVAKPSHCKIYWLT